MALFFLSVIVLVLIGISIILKILHKEYFSLLHLLFFILMIIIGILWVVERYFKSKKE